MRCWLITQSRISLESTLSVLATRRSISSRVVHRRTSNVRHGSGPPTGGLFQFPACFGLEAGLPGTFREDSEHNRAVGGGKQAVEW